MRPYPLWRVQRPRDGLSPPLVRPPTSLPMDLHHLGTIRQTRPHLRIAPHRVPRENDKGVLCACGGEGGVPREVV